LPASAIGGGFDGARRSTSPGNGSSPDAPPPSGTGWSAPATTSRA